MEQAVRIQTSILSDVEKKALIWLAQRMPSWVSSDHLTALGFVALLGAGSAYWYAARDPVVGLTLVNVLLFLNWFGDSLDGTVARVRNRQRPRYGFYIDHVLDAVGAFALLGGLTASGFMSERVGFLLTIVYLLLNIETYLATYTLNKFKMAHGKFGPTELRVLLIVGNLFLLRSPSANLFGERFLLFDLGAVVGVAGMAFMLVRAIWTNGSQLYREETLD